jgi:hypothetical protein
LPQAREGRRFHECVILSGPTGAHHKDLPTPASKSAWRKDMVEDFPIPT